MPTTRDPLASFLVLLFVLHASLALVACDETSETVDAGGAVDAGSTDAGPPDAGPPPPFALTSSAFVEGGTIPLRYECGPPVIADGPGENVTPPLAWTAGPAETMSYALVVRDIDAGGLVHWVVYDIPTTVFEIAEDVSAGFMLATPAGAKQAELQGSGYFGYLGPCSDASINSYQFTLHAIGTATLPGVDRTTTETAAAAAVEVASIASAVLTGES